MPPVLTLEERVTRLERQVGASREDGRVLSDTCDEILERLGTVETTLQDHGLRLDSIDTTLTKINGTLDEILRRLPTSSA